MKSSSKKDLQPGIKTGFFNFSQIEKYFVNAGQENVFQRISDRTFQDLDLEDVFRFIDRTVSSVGQQYLYHHIRTIPLGTSRTEKLGSFISILTKNPTLRATASASISKLNQKDAYYITSLFQEKYMPRPKWFWLIQCLSGLSVAAVLLSFFLPQILIFLIVLLPVNLGIHYWNKNHLYRYASSLPQLVLLNKTARNLLKTAEFEGGDPDFQKSVRVLDRLGITMSVFQIEAKLQSEVGQFIEYFLELIKALFLVEPVLLFATLKMLDNRRQDISNVFHFVAGLDVALSTMNLRESLPHYCEPTFVTDNKLTINEVYHPLIFNGVANNIELNSRSALLTGSNMSGKTTFIRTIGINAILGQTIRTCFAKEFVMPVMQVHSSIRISDDLLGEKSYYFEEVMTVRQLLEESRTGACNLFLLDELFKGTNSVERIAVGKSVLSYLTQGGNLVLVSTHDRELADYLTDTFDLYHFTEVIDGNDIHFDYKIKPGKLTTTNAIRILELNNYPAEVVNEALRLSAQMKEASDNK
ncbi:DNA mismatch repair protein MutS [Dyadobacter sp. CECT 9623]|uniref:DNA mismatch repair protein MutS n=1 Tax=Dyadobacter linearis TaxID=2823330 RepID=A0ABM8UJQ4_9BACT|nr:DNA mismatch repair protein MutS [Dyadobacter sp. CECT 9623]CAG5067624.1 DNA mismatch repair protein MutS [Dyadobacter sp. CECT 9623]